MTNWENKILTSVIDLNSRREFNYYRKTSIVVIIEELWAWLKVTSFDLITGLSPFWSFYAPETGNASGTNKIVQAQKLNKREDWACWLYERGPGDTSDAIC